MLNTSFEPFPVLQTSRLVLRQMKEDDLQEIFFLRSDPTVLTYIGREPVADTIAAKKYLDDVTNGINAGDLIVWGICLKENTSRIIGSMGFWRMQKEHYRAEIGYVLHPDHWRKGFIKEAIRTVVQFGFTRIQLHSIEARIDARNEASAAVLRSAGFVQEGYFKEDYFFRGSFSNTIVFGLLNNVAKT